MDSLLHLNTKNDQIKKKTVFILLFFFKYARDFSGILQKIKTSPKSKLLSIYKKLTIFFWIFEISVCTYVFIVN